MLVQIECIIIMVWRIYCICYAHKLKIKTFYESIMIGYRKRTQA